VGDAYAQGTVSLLDLIDAQNNDLVAELVAADAVFEFFIDMMETERAAGKFSLFMNEDEKTARTNRIEAFYKNSPEE
jgi:outer membrane protein TolC